MNILFHAQTSIYCYDEITLTFSPRIVFAFEKIISYIRTSTAVQWSDFVVIWHVALARDGKAAVLPDLSRALRG